MPRAFRTIELMTCESMTRLLCSTGCLVLRSLIRFHNWQLLHPQTVVLENCPRVEKDQDTPLLVPTLALPAHQRDSWAMQCNFDFPRCDDWVLTLDLWQEGAHEGRDSRTKTHAGVQ